jgi:hypothetical protein
LTLAAFKILARKRNLRSQKMIEACRLVLVEGRSRRAASLSAGVNYASLHRMVRKLQGLCPHCGQPLPDAKPTTKDATQ